MEVKVVSNENFDWTAFEQDLGIYDQPKEQISAAYDKTMSNVNVGEVVEGTVTAITKREVLVNIGYKSEGVISVAEFRYNPELKVGDAVEVYVDSAEDKNGQLALSHKKARQLKSWDRVNEALEKDEPSCARATADRSYPRPSQHIPLRRHRSAARGCNGTRKPR